MENEVILSLRNTTHYRGLYKSNKTGVENHLIWENELIWSSRPIIWLEDKSNLEGRIYLGAGNKITSA